MTDAFVWWR